MTPTTQTDYKIQNRNCNACDKALDTEHHYVSMSRFYNSVPLCPECGLDEALLKRASPVLQERISRWTSW